MPEIKFYNPYDINDSLLEYAVVAAKRNGAWLFCRHKNRDTWEMPGGKREQGEKIDEAAKRELYEETGAVEYKLSKLLLYSVNDGKRETFGALYFADVTEQGPLPQSEIGKVHQFDMMPSELTYPDIQPILFEKVTECLNMTERQKMLAGMYYCLDDELKDQFKNARLLTEKINASSFADADKRVEYIKQLFGSCGEQIYIEPDFHCDFGCNIHVGDNFYANYGCVILDCAEVRIGKNCFIAPQVGIYTATHPVNPTERNSRVEYAKSVTIGDNCWICGHAVINPGVTLGNNVVVASGAVVTKSFGDNVVIGGNPARVIKKVEE